MIRVLRGVIHGRTIELADEPGRVCEREPSPLPPSIHC